MILVFGYQAVGHACLEALLESGERDLVLVTHRDRDGETIWWPSAAELAKGAGVPVHYSDDFDRGELIEWTRARAPRLIYSFYYRDLLPMKALRVADLGAYNMHGSLLPAFRGRCPVNWAVLSGADTTGVTLHHMVSRADAGDIVGQRSLPIGVRDTAIDVFRGMVPLARDLLIDCHPRICDGSAPRIPQDESAATTFGGRRPEDGAIDWTRPADEIDALIRAVTHPYPGAFCRLGDQQLFVWQAEPVSPSPSGVPGQVVQRDDSRVRVLCGRGALELVRVSIGSGPEVDGAVVAADKLDSG